MNVRTLALATLLLANTTYAITIDMVLIGEPGNAMDTRWTDWKNTPLEFGAVNYVYAIGKYEISRSQYAESLGLVVEDDRPAKVTFYEAQQFCDWLYATTNRQYDLPKENEWYKAAYYDPASGTYFEYPTGSNSPPIPVASGTEPGTAVYDGQLDMAPVMLAGGLSPYGTMGQGGNAGEWNATIYDIDHRGSRGGGIYKYEGYEALRLHASHGTYDQPNGGGLGFRVVLRGIPEPSSLLLFCLGVLGSALCRKHGKR